MRLVCQEVKTEKTWFRKLIYAKIKQRADWFSSLCCFGIRVVCKTRGKATPQSNCYSHVGLYLIVRADQQFCFYFLNDQTDHEAP